VSARVSFWVMDSACSLLVAPRLRAGAAPVDAPAPPWDRLSGNVVT
jgi:hypothetical protein